MTFLIGRPKPRKGDSVKVKNWGKESERSGAPRRRTAGGFLSDMAFLQKAILLCNRCAPKWDPAKYDYETRDIWPGQNFVNSKCDTCGYFTRCTLHMPKGS